MNTGIALLFIVIALTYSCQDNKLNSSYLTKVQVKRQAVYPPQSTDTPKDTLQPVTAQPTPPPTAPTPSLKEEKIVTQPMKSYHIIAASHPDSITAKKSVNKFKSKGLSETRVIWKNDRYRISIANHANKQQAQQLLDSLIKRTGQKDLWITRY